VVDGDRSPRPASRHAEGCARGSMGRCRSKTGRQLVRVRASQDQETVWEDVWSGRTAERLALLQTVLEQAEQRLGLAGDSADAHSKRARTEIRLARAWGRARVITWLLARGYQVTGTCTSTLRGHQLVQGIREWQPTSRPGRDVAPLPHPLTFVRPLAP
jgi:hypothetical protein